MITGMDVAKYFLSKDTERKLFTKKLVTKNGRSFYDGNARLNKYIHLAHNIYLAKCDVLLVNSDFYAYDNGAVIPDVQENYVILWGRVIEAPNFPTEIKTFLDKIYLMLENATIEELIELSHEDDEWRSKHNFYHKEQQKMDSAGRIKEYKEQYADVITMMDRIAINATN